MVSDRLRRRRLLQLGGAAFAVAVAGCTDDDDDLDEDVDEDANPDEDDGGDDEGNGEGDEEDDGDEDEEADEEPSIWGPVPEYADWVGEEEVSAALAGESEDDAGVIFVDAGRWDEFEDDDDEEAEDDDLEEPSLAVPVAGVLGFALGFGFGTFGYPFQDRVQLGGFSDPEERPEDPVAVVEQGLSVGNAFVLWGDVDADALVDAAEGFERAEERGGFELYAQEGPEGEPGDLAFAVGDDVLVLMTMPSDGVDHDEEDVASLLPLLEDRIDLASGDAARAVDEVAQFERLARATDPGLVMLGTIGQDVTATEDDEEDGGGFEDLEAALDQIHRLGGSKFGLFGSMDVDTDGESVSTETTLGYEDEGGVPDRAEIEGVLGMGASDRAVTVEGEYVHVGATWTEELGGEQLRVRPR